MEKIRKIQEEFNKVIDNGKLSELSLKKIEGSEHEREVISNHYAGYNLND